LPNNDNKTETKRGFGARVADKALDRLIGKLDEKDRRAAAKRVEKLRVKNPAADTQTIADLLIKRKCRRTAVVGAITAAPATIPGLGTLTSLVLGSSVDLAISAGLLAELVLELAACHGVQMSPSEERAAILMVTGLGAGANKLVQSAGRRVAGKASERLAQKSVARALPVIGIGAAAGANMVSTYLIGRRANAYFVYGPDRAEDWGESLRAVTGVDERKMVSWMNEAAESTRTLLGNRARASRDAVITVAQSSGALVVEQASRARRLLWRAGNRLSRFPWRSGHARTGEQEEEGTAPMRSAEKRGKNSDS
jgi:hypothetical protein